MQSSRFATGSGWALFDKVGLLALPPPGKASTSMMRFCLPQRPPLLMRGRSLFTVRDTGIMVKNLFMKFDSLQARDQQYILDNRQKTNTKK